MVSVILSLYGDANFAASEYWKGKGKSQPSNDLGGSNYALLLQCSYLICFCYLRSNHVVFSMLFQNSIGGLSHHSGGHVNEPFMLVGLHLKLTIYL